MSLVIRPPLFFGAGIFNPVLQELMLLPFTKELPRPVKLLLRQ